MCGCFKERLYIHHQAEDELSISRCSLIHCAALVATSRQETPPLNPDTSSHVRVQGLNQDMGSGVGIQTGVAQRRMSCIS